MKKLYSDMRIFKILLFVSLIFRCSGLICQNIFIEAKVDTHSIMIGDWINLKIKAEHGSEITIRWPKIEESIGKFEVVKRDSLPTIINSDGRIIEELRGIISVYDSGYFQIPAIRFGYITTSDTTEKEIFSRPINISSSTLDVDTTKEIRELKPPIDIPFPVWLILQYIAIVLFILLLAYALWRKFRSKKIMSIFDKVEPELAAHEIAYKELYHLEEKKLWQKGMVKEYYSEVTEIIRKYIYKRYSIDAMEMTSDEILNTIMNINSDKKIQEILKLFLNLADFVKFAKYQPIPNENELEIKRAFSFVEETKEKNNVVTEQKSEQIDQ